MSDVQTTCGECGETHQNYLYGRDEGPPELRVWICDACGAEILTDELGNRVGEDDE
jgi:transposase